jgi:metal-dependent amidase/aminoacylase/carboxypeptidase family protein
VVAILQNGSGPRLLIRTDLDALPIVEETGLPYASQVKVKDAAGREVGVMHACGHDVHVTTMIGTARALMASRSHWHGTVMVVGQPSEETVDGARAILSGHTSVSARRISRSRFTIPTPARPEQYRSPAGRH